MNDTFYELLVKKNKPEINTLILAAANVAAVVVFAALSLIIQFSLIIAIALGFVFYYLVYPRLFVEYEYSLLNSDITVDVIYNKSKRKNVLNIDVKTLTSIFPVTSPKMQGRQSGRISDYSDGSPDTSYCLIFPGTGENTSILLSLDDRMLEMIKRISPRAFM